MNKNKRAVCGEKLRFLCAIGDMLGGSDNRDIMTDQLNQQSELKKMASTQELCDPCAGIQRNWRRAPGHAELEQGGNRQEDMRQNRHSQPKHGLVTITKPTSRRAGRWWGFLASWAELLLSCFFGLPLSAFVQKPRQERQQQHRAWNGPNKKVRAD